MRTLQDTLDRLATSRATVRLPSGETCGHIHKNIKSAGACLSRLLATYSAAYMRINWDKFKIEAVND